MYNENDAIRAIKQVVKGVISSSKLCDLVFGTVESASPLKIRIDQKLVLESGELIIGSVCKSDPLNVNESVVLLRQSGGQQFFVLDRGEEATDG
jgi:hypothetical protein